MADRFTYDPAAAVAATRATSSPPSELAALLLVPGRTLTTADVALLRALLPIPAWQLRRDRTQARNAAIRQALAACAPLDRANSAKRVARAWASILRGAAPAAELAAPLRKAAELHGKNHPLSWIQIEQIGRGAPAPADVEKT